jgi:hypothetical protein
MTVVLQLQAASQVSAELEVELIVNVADGCWVTST